MMRRLFGVVFGAAALVGGVALAAVGSYGLSLFGELKYPADFSHFAYANPDAPKGGAMKFAAIGTYDTLNPFIIKGVPATGIGMIFDRLMTQSLDEPGSEYGLVA